LVKRFLTFNGIAIISVILFHAVGQGFVALFFWADRYRPVSVPNFDQVGSLTYFAFRTVEQIAVFSIPFFLFVSGYFIAFATGRIQKNIRSPVIMARVRDLIIPYLFWSFVVIFLEIALEGRIRTPGRYLSMLLVGGASPAYYYIPLLIQFYLLTPLLVPLAKNRWVGLLTVVALIQIIVQLLHYPVLLGLESPALEPLINLVPKWLFVARIFWFTFGVIVGFQLKKIKPFLSSSKWWLLGASLLMIPLGILEWEAYLRISGEVWIDHRETIIDTIYSFLVILTVIGFDRMVIPFSERFSSLGTKSFGIYIVHPIVMIYLSRLIARFAPQILGNQILFQTIIIALGLGVPLLMMYAVDHSPFRRVYRYIFG